ncbi:MAG TPA: hypothetical protein VHZ51_14020 [Ktedonobacteraceae bacterium]|nr:hypothetical protein [Ktedonobacteraceae bacterium]
MRLTTVVVFCRRLVARFVPPRIAMQVAAGPPARAGEPALLKLGDDPSRVLFTSRIIVP